MIYQIGAKYFVRALRSSDLAGPYMSWFEDQEVCRFNSHGKLFPSEDYFRSYIASLGDADRIVWAICHQVDGHIGNISLQGISLINRHAEFAILIGDRRHWNQGVGKMAGAKLVQHGFEKLNLQRIYCGIAAPNLGMRQLAVALSFKEEGCQRKHIYLDGDWVDVIEYGMLREDLNQK